MYVISPVSKRRFFANQITVAVEQQTAPPPPGKKKPSKPTKFVPFTEMLKDLTQGELAQVPTSPGSPPSGGAASTSPPQWMTNFGAIGTALATLKSGMSYSSNSFQPPVQSFSPMLEEAITKVSNKFLAPYTSTSILYVEEAAETLSESLAKMQGYSNDVTAWTALCKPVSAGIPIPAPCTEQDISALLADASQLITAYTTLVANPSDGSGNPVLLDILHGAMLYRTFPCPSGVSCNDDAQRRTYTIQFTVAAAAGSTRTNAFFLLNIFYTRSHRTTPVS